MVFLLGLTAALAAVWISLRQLYWWQVKEYRWDRWWSWIKYNQGGQELVRLSFRQPKLTGRIVLITILILVGGYLIWPTWIGLIIWGYLGPALGILFTWPINEVGRIWLVRNASLRVKEVKPRVIGITGSYGKTSSKEILAKMLADKYRLVKTLNNENTELGIAKRILADLKPGVEVLVVEIGAYKRGEIARICQMFPLDIAWVTAIGNQHLDLFGNLNNLKRAKFELVESLRPGGTAVLDADLGTDDLIDWAKHKQVRTVVYHAVGPQANRVGAVEVAKLLGVKPTGKFLELNWVTRTTPRGVVVIDDSYSTNQQGFEAAITYLKQQSGRKFVITPGIIELGSQTEAVHRELAKQLTGLDGVWVTSSWARPLLKGQNLDTLTTTLRTGDVLLIEGRIPSNLQQKILQL